MTYALPPAVLAWLAVALAGRRNASACLALATYLGRMHGSPTNLGRKYPLCRRALSAVPALGLTEGQARAAIEALREIGFVVVQEEPGSRYRVTSEGRKRKPLQFRFGSEVEALLRASVRAFTHKSHADSRVTPMNAPQKVSNARVPSGLSMTPKYASQGATITAFDTTGLPKVGGFSHYRSDIRGERATALAELEAKAGSWAIREGSVLLSEAALRPRWRP
jgi:hypothetical protein